MQGSTPFGQRQVVVAENDDDVRELIGLYLGRADFSMVPADRGDLALRAIIDNRPSACLLDILLPVVSGLEVIQAVRARPQLRHLPIMIISARADEASIDRGLAVGADDYVTKPFSPGDMVRRLSALLDVASGDPLGGSAATRGSLT